MSLVILHPGVENRAEAEVKVALRAPMDASPARIGLLVNGKANAGEILEGVRDALAPRLAAEWIVFTKAGPTTAIAPDLLARVQEQCTAVVAAVGD